MRPRLVGVVGELRSGDGRLLARKGHRYDP